MSLKISVATANAAANSIGLKEQFDNGLLIIFSGPVPDTADEALDLVTEHTELVVISDNDTGDGLDFAAPSGGVLGKSGGQTWTGTVAFDGFEDGETDLTPTFYRFCADGDNGRGAADGSTGYRVQGTVGGPNSGADLQLGANDLTNGNLQPIGAFGWRLGQ